ncbi:Uncharacterized protein Nst1_645 [Candidatus Nanobsidianus stetteri]|uniref:Uncharacterized protein n=1 Tax=Nanobsidianus stetteri TaxID=1294122 RepID=R1E3K3_NANST|nr:Uncharacterized protein Nst1_645 [Candidatus Nanobsidianus stetteri]
MKNQINTLAFVIIISIIILLIVLVYLLSTSSSSKITQTYNVENQYTLTIQNSVDLLPYIYDNKVNLSYAFLLSYFSSSGNDTYCINQNTCTNISEDLINYFDSIYGNRWNLTIYFIPPVTGWVVQMFIIGGNIGNWDPCSMNPPPDPNGTQWYEWNYTYFFVDNYTENINLPNVYNPITNTPISQTLYGAGWVNATAPFHQSNSISSWGLPTLYNNLDQSQAIQTGFCTPLTKIFPNYNFTEASVYCPQGKWNLFPNFGTSPTSSLPQFFSGWIGIGTPVAGSQYLTDVGYYYYGPPTYKTATDINRLAEFIIPQQYLDKICQEEFGTQQCGSQELIVGSFYRGVVNIPPNCQQVFIDYPWHEVIRLYISFLNKSGEPDYVFLAADPLCEYNLNGKLIDCPTGVFDNIQNVNGIIVGKDCPLVYLMDQNSYAEGLYRFNITKWVIDDRDSNTNQFIISAVYYDPHNGGNGVAMARVYCITNTGNKEELNAYIYQGNEESINLGYPIPPNTNIYVYYIYLPVDVSFLGGYLVAKLTVW